MPSNSKTHEKISSIANQALEKNGTTWYVELPPTQEEKPPVIGKLSSNKVQIISEALKTKEKKPTPPSRSHVIPSPTPEHSKMDTQKQAFSPKLSDVIDAKKALNSTDKKVPPTPLPRSNTTCLSPTSEHSNDQKAPVKNTPPLPLPQKNKPKFEPVSVTALTPPKKRVSFQTGETTKDLETSLSVTPSTKDILKETSSFSNTEENKSHNATSSLKKIHSSPESNEKLDEKEALELAMAELNEVLKSLELDPVSRDLPK